MKTFLLSVVLAWSLNASQQSMKYDIAMKVLGHIGISQINLVTDEDNYHIYMNVQMDKSLSDVEHRYESIGQVVKGVYVPDYFIKYIRKGENEVTYYYLFDHDKQLIHKYTTTVEIPSVMASLFSLSDDEKEVSNHYELLVNFSPNDTLTTFLNAKTLLGLQDEMHVNSVGFRSDKRSIMLTRHQNEYQVSIDDEKNDFYIMISVATDGLVKNISIQEYSMLGNINVTRTTKEN